ncbi:conjugal transfer protein TraJ [Campylobacter sp. MIT 12-8780]|uniref:virB8 family protein n=1 Tax=unclassified Campylobacter TaxID=2593542 RepID=UPI0010F81883|nr:MULTISPECIES: type IV secretion system protein [unclassified Campylobacter]NDJ28068.1 type IV secretion system protein [Campylobacter sp. MIT 19-121]TKX28250.1 conjugal transfer protein TraJ [Campylobacter sp. MIT 12-5580]TQR39966.1 conjugal transfer protein TraJ [Campylobacter sp. MIT 12-8780]
MYKEAIDFESSVRYLIEQSNKRAWLVAFVSIFVAILSIVAVLLLTPLKSVEPYVIRVDNTTGMVDILTTLDEEQITSIEALDKHFVSQYIKAREGYYYDMLNQDYIFVQLLSTPQIAEAYRAIYSGDNPRDAKLGNNFQVEVQILSIVLNESNGAKTATARINLKTINKNSKAESIATKVITLSYEYQTAQVNEENRLLNPLGFKVTNYRIDEEITR